MLSVMDFCLTYMWTLSFIAMQFLYNFYWQFTSHWQYLMLTVYTLRLKFFFSSQKLSLPLSKHTMWPRTFIFDRSINFLICSLTENPKMDRIENPAAICKGSNWIWTETSPFQNNVVVEPRLQTVTKISHVYCNTPSSETLWLSLNIYTNTWRTAT